MMISMPKEQQTIEWPVEKPVQEYFPGRMDEIAVSVRSEISGIFKILQEMGAHRIVHPYEEERERVRMAAIDLLNAIRILKKDNPEELAIRFSTLMNGIHQGSNDLLPWLSVTIGKMHKAAREVKKARSLL